VEDLLAQERDPTADRGVRSGGIAATKKRDKTRVISFRVPHNAAVQIYDYKNKKARFVIDSFFCSFFLIFLLSFSLNIIVLNII